MSGMETNGNEVEGILRGFQDTTGGPAELLIHVNDQSEYEIRYLNVNGARHFKMPQVNLGGEPLLWEDLTDELASYLHQTFSTFSTEENQTLPIFEIEGDEGRSFSVNLKVKVREGGGEKEYWFYFIFNEVTSWIGLQEEVMNARRLESIGGLASGVAHDFNNIILAIQGYSEYLLMTKQLDEETKRALSQIMKACSNGTALTRSLLGYSRKQSLSMGVLNVLEMASDVISLCRHSYGSRYHIQLEGALAQKEKLSEDQKQKLQIYGCYSALSHCFLNILNNARDAMKTGGDVYVDCVYESYTVKLSIRDSGTGIDPEYINKIFDPFFTTKEKGAGTGLGLSMVQGIMQQHGGKVDIASKMGTGTTVTLSWPVYHAKEDTAKIKKAYEELDTKSAPPPPRSVGTQHKRALLIEDDPIVAGSVTSLLKIQKIAVDQYMSGKGALKALEDGLEVSLILCDYTMPEMDGTEFLNQSYELFKQRNQLDKVRAILMSGFPPEHFESFINECPGFHIHLLQKPFSSQTLKSLITTRQKRFLRKITTRVQIDPTSVAKGLAEQGLKPLG